MGCLDRCHDLAVHHDTKTGVVVLEYASEGRVVATGALTELVAGLCLALGFLTPLASAAAVGVMLTAIATAHWTKGFFNQDGGYEFPLLMAATALAVTFTGRGGHSLDRLFDWTLAGDEWGIAALAVGVASFGLLLGERELRARRMHTPPPPVRLMLGAAG